jgi:hypothetical protein
VEPDLYVLLGLSPSVGAAELRARYEDAIAGAARWQDFDRLKKLSQAFDRLPISRRVAVYPGGDRSAMPRYAGDLSSWSGSMATPQRRWTQARVPPAATRRHIRRLERKARAAAAYQYTGMRRPFRLALYGVGVLVLVAGGAGLLQRVGVLDRPTQHYIEEVPTRQTLTLPSTIVVPAPPAGHIAPTLQTDANGYIYAICQKEPLGAGSMMRVRPGSHVECADGAVPAFMPGD